MKRILLIAAGGLLAISAGLVAVVVLEMHRAPSFARGTVIRFEVPGGQPFAVVAERLERRGLIRHARPIRIYAAATGSDRHIHQGVYEFTIGERPRDIIRRLSAGDILVVEVTVPEGFTKWEIAGVFAPAGVDSAELFAAIHDPEILRRREIPVASLEGYLFPDTYHVPYLASAEDVVSMMLARMDDVFNEELIARAVEMDMTPQQVLALASIVEAEARVGSERPVISAVYHNRLSRNMRLEADPTVAYAMDGYRGRLYYKDLEIDSPYNTYRNPGLPPGPICSPGAAAIHAALYPDTATDALYFVARGDGSHIFSRTLTEHNAAVRRVRSESRSAARFSTRDEPARAASPSGRN